MRCRARYTLRGEWDLYHIESQCDVSVLQSKISAKGVNDVESRNNRKDIQDVVTEVNQYIAEREKLDPVAVYAQLKAIYPLVLTMEPCYDYEIPVLSGQSSLGKFELYDNGLDILFEVTKPDGTYTHWHPLNVAEAMEDVRAFMQGACSF